MPLKDMTSDQFKLVLLKYNAYNIQLVSWFGILFLTQEIER